MIITKSKRATRFRSCRCKTHKLSSVNNEAMNVEPDAAALENWEKLFRKIKKESEIDEDGNGDGFIDVKLPDDEAYSLSV
jgi:hypothetical protein